MTWAKMRRMVVSAEDTHESQDDMIAIQEYKTPTPPPTAQREKIAICRTPMGEYIVPEGKKPLTSLGLSYPGPADYVPKVEITKSAAPQYSIVGRPKIIDGKRYIPGPFEYNCAGDIIWTDKTVSMKGRTKTHVDIEAEKSISAPGKYKVEYKGVGTEGPKYKIGTKLHAATWPVQPGDIYGFQTPGPNYRPNSSYWGRGHKKSFGKLLKVRSKTDEAPGPADYDVSHESRGPSHSFGIKLPEQGRAQQKLSKDTPAANLYDIGTTIGKAPAVSISGREKEHSESKKGPCPATYYPVRSTYNKYKATTLTYKRFEVNEPYSPGPTDYDVKHTNLKKSPEYTCRQRTKPTYPDKVVENAGPGPGAYQTVQEFYMNDKPAFSFRKRIYVKERSERETAPGPNAYRCENCEKPETKRAPAFSMAKRLTQTNSMKSIPGPAAYFPEMKQSAPKYTMTKRPQGKGTFVNPAPNSYLLPEVIVGKTKGVVFKSRASPYIYSGFRTNKLEEPTQLPQI